MCQKLEAITMPENYTQTHTHEMEQIASESGNIIGIYDAINESFMDRKSTHIDFYSLSCQQT
jgi:hypothetical protein